MSRKISYSTYAVSLYFDDESAGEISCCVKNVAEVCGNFYMTGHEVPPHMTVGIFHAEESEVKKLKSLFVQYAESFSGPLLLNFERMDTFADKVLFLKPLFSDKLIFLNKMLHEIFIPHFEAGANRNYLPEKWYPHIALAVKLEAEQFQKARELAGAAESPAGRQSCSLSTELNKTGLEESDKFSKQKKEIIAFPKSASLISLGLAKCHPYEEIMRIIL